MSRLARPAWATVSGTPLATRRRRCASSATSGHGDGLGVGGGAFFGDGAGGGDGGDWNVVGSIPGRIVVRDHDGDGDDVRVASRSVTASHLESARGPRVARLARIIVNYAGNGPRQRVALISIQVSVSKMADVAHRRFAPSALCHA